jgi:hypothetical protein
MADLGSVGRNGLETYIASDIGPRCNFRCISAGESYLAVGGRDNAEGNSQPCLRLDSRGMWRFRWVVTAGNRSISVDVKQEENVNPRPTLVVKANPSCGIANDATGTAGAGQNWVTIGPVSVSPSSNGVVWVELRANYDCQYAGAPCFWDNIITT